MSSEREKEGLQSLGKKTEYRQDYAPEVLEAFENKHPDNDYWVRFNCPEFTSLCPITGQPDFAEIRISYIPDRRMVESKSLKLYLFSPQPRRLPRRLREQNHEGPHSSDGSEIHRSHRYLYSAWGDFHLSVCQLRPQRYEVRADGGVPHDES